jgi:hypothetical protein
MRWIKWTGIIAAIVLIIACFMPWVIISSVNITVTGVNATGTNFGKPGYFHFMTTSFFVVFTLIQKTWAKRANLLVTALNMAWAIRNYFMITLCRGGECPEKKIGIYFIVIASVLMLASALLPDLKMDRKKTIGIHQP